MSAKQNAKRRAAYWENRAHFLEYQYAYNERNKERRLEYQREYRARKKATQTLAQQREAKRERARRHQQYKQERIAWEKARKAEAPTILARTVRNHPLFVAEKRARMAQEAPRM